MPITEQMTLTLSEKARAFLSDLRFGVLATINPNGMPHLTAMWYGLESDEEVLLSTRIGRIKDVNLSRDPRASICVEDGYKYVTLAGTVRLIKDQATAHEDMRRLAIRYRGPEGGEQMMRDFFSKKQLVSIRMSIDWIFERL